MEILGYSSQDLASLEVNDPELPRLSQCIIQWLHEYILSSNHFGYVNNPVVICLVCEGVGKSPQLRDSVLVRAGIQCPRLGI